jgi:hypothetical protein
MSGIDLTTVGVDRSRAKRLKEIRDAQGHRSLDETVELTIHAWDQLSGLEVPENNSTQ